MSAFPSYAQGKASKRKPRDDRQVDAATNGLLRGRALFDAAKWEFTVVLPGLTNAERDAVQAHYVANRLNSFDFVWARDGLTYTCWYAQNGEPDESYPAPLRTDIKVVLWT